MRQARGASKDRTRQDRLREVGSNVRFLKNAAWHFRLDPAPEGTRVSCVAEFRLRVRYLFLAPILFLMRGAIRRDLEQLRQVLEAR